MEYTRQSLLTLIAIGIVLSIGVLLTWYIVATHDSRQPSAADTLFATASSTSFTDTAGNVVELESFDRQVRIINSWASWSPFSTQELQDLNTIATEYADHNVVVLAINRDEPAERIEAFLQTLPDVSAITFVVDTEDGLYESFSGYAMPETLIYDARGNLVHHKRGVATLEELRSYTEQAIAASQ
jgi:cytochrome c biogenesis protein CcmG, thiol:disulfide interchange protein DsbE